MDAKTTTALAAFVATCQSVIDKHYKDDFPTLTPPRLTVDLGRRYARIVKNESSSSRSVHCFVDLTNGDVLKSESWKKPAKHARGSIFSAKNGEEAITAYGAHYLR